jgi:phospholipid/cholesterol/gamma-HCH transport system substrate-binding protein
MRQKVGRWRLFVNSVFVLAVLALAGFGAHQVAGRRWQVQPTFRVRANFETIGGVEAGHRVRLQGIDAGVVDQVIAPSEPGQPVELVLRIDARLRSLVRTDTVARIVSEGLVGARAVELIPGKPDAPAVREMDRIESERPVELSDLIKKGTATLARLDAISQAAEQGLGEINAIAASIRKGEGTAGKLVNDDALHNRMLELTKKGERTLTALEDNLDALKQTWPLSSYFSNRAYLDRERVLFQPAAEKKSRVLGSDQLFENNRAVLTSAGRTLLDEIGHWCKRDLKPTSEVVIAAFTSGTTDQELAEILTQEQADSVRKYLVANHGIQSAGWFRSRKVAAVGFGIHTPRAIDGPSPDLPPRRVEVILFTPRI